jgi:hypothetical protein
MPLLTSPSSKAHMMFRGMHPKNVNYGHDFNLVSKRIEIASGGGQKHTGY